MARCRRCTSNDDEVVIEYLAKKLWDIPLATLEAAGRQLHHLARNGR
ncbi:hypothetical protein [Sphingomonas sp. DC2300-3]